MCPRMPPIPLTDTRRNTQHYPYATFETHTCSKHPSRAASKHIPRTGWNSFCHGYVPAWGATVGWCMHGIGMWPRDVVDGGSRHRLAIAFSPFVTFALAEYVSAFFNAVLRCDAWGRDRSIVLLAIVHKV
ncbi:hypothetical protein JB92DRAFT_2912645 [Gautieria morchelliformis]|nr:hypothetical protein JB92DRAFT_2912645 [Gautieria morchelliformis]